MAQPDVCPSVRNPNCWRLHVKNKISRHCPWLGTQTCKDFARMPPDSEGSFPSEGWCAMNLINRQVATSQSTARSKGGGEPGRRGRPLLRYGPRLGPRQASRQGRRLLAAASALIVPATLLVQVG